MARARSGADQVTARTRLEERRTIIGLSVRLSTTAIPAAQLRGLTSPQAGLESECGLLSVAGWSSSSVESTMRIRQCVKEVRFCHNPI